MPSKVAALVCFWLVAAFPNYKSERNEIRAKVQLVNTYRAMAAQTPKLMVVGLDDSWIDGLPFERYVYHRTKLGLGLDFRQFAGSRYSIARDRRDHALWLVREPSPTLMLPFARNWNREYRSVLGRSYEVWIPRQG